MEGREVGPSRRPRDVGIHPLVLGVGWLTLGLSWVVPPDLGLLVVPHHVLVARLLVEQPALQILRRLVRRRLELDLLVALGGLRDVARVELVADRLERGLLDGRLRVGLPRQVEQQRLELLRASQVWGVDAAARIMNFTKQNMEARIMKDIGKGDKGLMQAIQESMFVFDNLIMSDDKSLQTLLRMVDTDLLVLALKGADEPLQEKLFGCMSKRAAANIMDEMEALGPVRLTEVQGAQKEIINVARRLSDEGTIVLAGRGGDDFV